MRNIATPTQCIHLRFTYFLRYTSYNFVKLLTTSHFVGSFLLKSSQNIENHKKCIIFILSYLMTPFGFWFFNLQKDHAIVLV